MWPFSSSYRFLPLDKVATLLSGSESSQANVIAEYDYVIIGGGTAGCVLASRLSEDPNVSVLLLERGGVPSWMSKVPLLAFANIFRQNSKADYIYNWYASIAPVDGIVERNADVNSNNAGCATRRFCTIWSPGKIALLAGKVLGGTSNLNAQIYTRPYPGELDTWGEGWEYAQVEHLLKKSEKSLSFGQSPHRGTECKLRCLLQSFHRLMVTLGPWLTKKIDKTLFGSDTQARKAANAMRVPTIHELNRPEGPAVGVFEFERTSHPRGYKLPTFEAFLPPKVVRERRNLTICTKTVVTFLDIGGRVDNKLQAQGVFLEPDKNQSKKKKAYYVAAKREVILCAGSIGSPQILMLSGVGPKPHLEEVGIPVLKDLPGVGEHLQDHAPISTTFAVPLQDSISILQKKPLLFILAFFKFLLFGVGYLVFPVPQSVIYLRSALLTDEGEILKESDIPSSELDTRSPDNIPDIKINIDPCMTTFRPLPDHKGKGYFSLFTGGLLPRSLGHVRLLSKDPFEKADCMLGFNAREEDRHVMRKAIRFCVKLAQKMKEQGYDIEPLLVPKSNDDKDLDDFILEEPRTGYHYSSTCRMAPEHPQNPLDPNDTPGVVDHELRVYGVHQLRVADASIFPTIPAGHPQVHTVLVAEKCAEMLKASWR